MELGSRLTEHLLRFAGRRPVRPALLHLRRTLPELHELLRSVLGRHVSIRVTVAPDTAPVRVDASEFELALINLALNARDAMPDGGEVRLSARNASAEESDGLPPGPAVLVSVGDDGPGISAEVVERAFEPFFTTKAAGLGSGLGLSQVHGFATQSGGLARIASTPGLGTSVSIVLPAATEDRAAGTVPALAAGAGAPREGGDAPGDVAGLHILVVEDNEDLGSVTAELLREHGARVERAPQADEALEWIEAGHRCDVVLSDVVMPGRFDGVELARRLKRRAPPVPVVLTTGFSRSATRVPGEFTVLRKPCPLDLLLRTLAAAARPDAAPDGSHDP
ncbi:sensory box histidine kinase/response regulator [Piscinibacter sakaiensis]|uniref:histidine kinase n=1 Tax=Piscinibacter sakaiensis TaxID=1547922 RepID=A0A0K8P7W9_PISS1|nr:sensory box histidine kinase/response regulator [Piscinibacter sakaiensis]